jgi:lipid A 3-O-deacylase
MAAFRPLRALAALVLCAVFGVLAPARADDPAFLTGSVGHYDLFDNMEATAFNFEYRSSKKLLFLKPFAGVMGTTDKAFYGYGGLLVDVYLGRRLVLTGNTAVGAYHDGDGKDLGHWVEFRSGLELAFRFDNRARLGLGIHHISNMGIGHHNPGTEILSVIFSWPLGNGN